MNPGRPFRIITGVIGEALRSTGAPGAVVGGEGPEGELLKDWLTRAGVSVRGVRGEGVTLAGELLRQSAESLSPEPPGAPAGHLVLAEQAAAALAARALAEVGGLLLLGTATKTVLLLSRSPPTEPVLPLGDLYASEVLDLVGACTLPPALRGCDGETVAAVDRALQAYFEGGSGLEDAFGSLESALGERLMAAVGASWREWHPRPLVPKMRANTLGIDLDL